MSADMIRTDALNAAGALFSGQLSRV